MKKIVFTLSILFLFFSACINSVPKDKIKTKSLPQFNPDTAYFFIKKQVLIGPRVPNTPTHDSVANFIIQRLNNYGFVVSKQNFTVLRYDSLPMHCINIFAQLDTTLQHRIILFTHWDSRFMAEKDCDSLLRQQPIPGANDGSSGTAVLLELARIISKNHPDIGVDLLFLDAEDQGPPEFIHLEDFYKYWALGSQYWADHKPKNYKPLWGVGLDLVGSQNTKFAIEDNSLFFFGFLIKKVWQIANTLGYDSIFVDKRTRGLINDHIVMSQKAKIRSILISENIPGKIYGNYWHTHKDSLDIIDKRVLKAVGQTIVTLIYNVK